MNVNNFEEQFGDEYPTGVWGEFKKEISSNICDIVVALASFHGESKFFACTGFFIDYGRCPTVLTSASLVRDPDGANEIVSGLRITVLLPNNQRTVGKLEHYSLRYNIALVSVKNYNVDCPVKLESEKYNDDCGVKLESKKYNVDCPLKLESKMINYGKMVVAVGRCFESGILSAASGKYIQNYVEKSNSNCRYLRYTTCKTTKAVIGGPLVDLDGKFMGINYYHTEIGTPFLFFCSICEILDDLKMKKAAIGGHEGRVRSDNAPNIWVLPA